MKLSILNEALSPIVYHFTSIRNAISILKENRFRLTSAMAKETESNYAKKDKYFFLSTARTKLTNYSRSSLEMIAFVLDGNALNAKYSGFPIEYFKNRTRPEYEDRLISKTPYINDAAKYIKRVDVYLKSSLIDLYMKKGILQTLVHYANQDNVKVYIYYDDHINKFDASKNGIEANEFIKSYKANNPNVNFDQNYELEDDKFEDELIPYVNLLNGQHLEDKTVKDLLYLIKYHIDDFIMRLKVEFHNYYKTESARLLTQTAAKLGLKNVNDIVSFLKNKYSFKK